MCFLHFRNNLLIVETRLKNFLNILARALQKKILTTIKVQLAMQQQIVYLSI